MRVVIRLHPIGMVTGCVALFHPTADVFLRPLRHLQQSDPHPGRGGALPGEQMGGARDPIRRHRDAENARV